MSNLSIKDCEIRRVDVRPRSINIICTLRKEDSNKKGRAEYGEIPYKLYMGYEKDFNLADSGIVVAQGVFKKTLIINRDNKVSARVFLPTWFDRTPVYFALEVNPQRTIAESNYEDNITRFSWGESNTVPPSSKFNDLSLKEVTVSKNNVEIGDVIGVRAKLLNAGTEQIKGVNVKVALNNGANETEILSMTGWAARPGQEITLILNGIVPRVTPGQYQLSVVVDPIDRFKDVDRGDNSVSIPLLVENRVTDGDEFNFNTGYGLINAKAAVEEAIRLKELPTPLEALSVPVNINWEEVEANLSHEEKTIEIKPLELASIPNIGDFKRDVTNVAEVHAAGIKGDGVIVAVIDSGVDVTHSDLAANAWRDDNGNFGYNFADDNYDTSDRMGHGTHVAGIIAALEDEDKVTGIAPKAKIMTVKVIGGKTIGTSWDIAQGIRYAVDNGARVINISLGGHFPMQSVETAIKYATSRNVVCICAAGNSSGSVPLYPAYYALETGIAAGAIDGSVSLAGFSNKAGTDNRMAYLVAPGVNIASTLPRNNRFGGMTGTSMASPVIAGIVALMLSANPNLTHNQVRDILVNTACHY